MENPRDGGLEQPSSDGRRRRSQRSREHILQALAEALSEPDFDPSPEQIAARSGYSITTIFRHFGDQQGVAAAMRELVRARVGEHLAAGSFEGDLPTRLAELVRRLAAVFETVEPFLRVVARQRQQREADAAYRRRLDQLVREQTSAALDGELTSLPPEVAEILAALLSSATWDHMRSTQGHSVERASELLRSAALRLLGAER